MSTPQGGAWIPPPPAEIQANPALVSFAVKGIPPPTLLYVGRDDVLLFGVTCLSATGAVLFRGRFLNPDGKIKTFEKLCTVSSSRSRQMFSHIEGEGFLLSLVAISQQSQSIRGDTHAWAGISRAGIVFANQAQILFSGYTTFQHSIGWPGGPMKHGTEGPGNIRAVTGTTPASGAEITEAIPAGARWRLMAILFSLATAVAAANRRVSLIFDFGGTPFHQGFSIADQAASLTWGYNVAPFYPSNLNPIPTQIVIPISPVYLSMNMRFRTVTTGIQAADQYTAPQYLVEEWMGEP